MVVLVKKMDVMIDVNFNIVSVKCFIYGISLSYLFKDCMKFCGKMFKECKDYFFKNGYCLKCCGLRCYFCKNCKESVKCDMCGFIEYVIIFYLEFEFRSEYEGEQFRVSYEGESFYLGIYCIEVCGIKYSISKLCVKIVLVYVYLVGE